MLKLVEKLNKIHYPTLPLIQHGEAETIGVFWNGLIKNYLPNRDTVIRWHKLLLEYVEKDNAVFAIRFFNTAPIDRYDDLRRGFLTQTNDNYSFFYTDNFFAAYFQKMAIDGYVPSLDEFIEAFQNRIFPSRFGINTSNERKMLAIPQGKDPRINIAGFKLAHIFFVGKNYFYNGTNYSLRDIVLKYFPRGERTDWQQKMEGKTNTYFLRQLTVSKEARKFLVAQYLRFVHPFNYFLAPKKDFEKNSVCIEIAEYEPLLNYAYGYNLHTYGDIYREYLSLIMIDEKELKICAGHDIINIKYGSCYKENNMIIKQQNLDYTKVEESKNIEIKSLPTKLLPSDTYSLYKTQFESVQDYIKRLLPMLYSEGLLTPILLERMQDKKYSKNTFGINWPLLEPNSQKVKDSHGHNRYWLNYKFDKYYVCSQWWKDDFTIYDDKLSLWVKNLTT